MDDAPPPFGLFDPEDCDYATAAAAILPVPFERTVSYGTGTGAGPAAILQASAQVEEFDEELGYEPCKQGVATLPFCVPESKDLAEALGEIEAAARKPLTDGKFLLTLGGEHSLTLALVRAVLDVSGNEPLGVVQFDAHADLRDSYEGSPLSHACVLRRVLELNLPTLSVGLRSLSAPEAALIENRALPVIRAPELENPEAAEARFRNSLEALPRRIYLTFDLDFFDPSLVPATGTPEPGGGRWYPTLRLLRTLFETKDVVAMDLVELAPMAGHSSSDFVAARLAYKCLGYRTLGS